jgi:hypothetical protein
MVPIAFHYLQSSCFGPGLIDRSRPEFTIHISPCPISPSKRLVQIDLNDKGHVCNSRDAEWCHDVDAVIAEDLEFGELPKATRRSKQREATFRFSCQWDGKHSG